MPARYRARTEESPLIRELTEAEKLRQQQISAALRAQRDKGTAGNKALRDSILTNMANAIFDLISLSTSHEQFEAGLRQVFKKTGCTHLLVPPIRADLPTVAPALWLDRDDKQQQPPDFIKATYSQWLGKGLTRAHVHKLDAPLYNALARWLTVNKTLPPEVDLPTKSEQTSRDIGAAVLLPPNPEVADRLRLYRTASARQSRANSTPKP